MMAVDFTPGSPPIVGTPRQLFEITNSALAFSGEPLFSFCMAPDGQHFYTTRRLGTQTFQQHPPPATYIGIVPHWVDELRANAPAKAADPTLHR
jgi:hypothetical protein